MNELITFIGGMVPFSEFRGTAVFAFFVFNFPFEKALILSTLGGIAIVWPLVLFWNKLGNILQTRFYFIDKIFNYTHRKHKKHFEVWETLALFLFVALPLPGTGVWAASIVSYIFNFSIKRATLSIIIGTLTSATIYYILVSLGVFTLEKVSGLF